MSRTTRNIALLGLAALAATAGAGCVGARTIMRGQSPEPDVVVGTEMRFPDGFAQARSNTITSAGGAPSAFTTSAASSLAAAPSPARSD